MSASIRATIRYVVKGEKSIFYPADRAKSYWPPEDHEMVITDARPLLDRLSVARNGFTVLHHQTAVNNFANSTQIADVFLPEAVQLAMQVNGAVKAFAFGPVVRTDAPGSVQGALPAHGAHVDYGRPTIEDFARAALGDEAAYWLTKRVVLMNLWRPITTVYSSPLALCDASTVEAADLHPSEIRGGLMNMNRQPLFGFNLSYNAAHRWYYLPQMQPDEVFAFKLYDSDETRPQWTGHTAFNDPNTPTDAPPRQSIEVRTVSFIED